MAALQSHGVEVHFELVGRGFPLVMLPPAGFDGSFWRLAGYIDALDDVVTCVPVDPRGLGGSTRPAEAGGYRVGALAGDVLAIADQQGFARFAVSGASLGGAVGMLLAAEYPDRVAGLVLSGMCPVFDYSELRHTWRYLARLAREAGDARTRSGMSAIRKVCRPIPGFDGPSRGTPMSWPACWRDWSSTTGIAASTRARSPARHSSCWAIWRTRPP
jgi:pimeloyl-ACP methyl ester carboxylesterase